MSNKSAEAYLKTWAGQELVKKHSLIEYGVWEVLGEDPNCDFGGHHYQPHLGFFEGELKHVIAYAVQLNGFYTWGGGGILKKVPTPQKIDENSVPELVALKREEEELLEKLNKVRAQLGSK